MILLIDTGTWLKLDKLKGEKLFNPNRIYEWAEIQITHEVEFEIEHFKCSSWERKKTVIIPIKNQIVYNEAIELDFDVADASILSNGQKENLEYLIVSEDRPLMDFIQMKGFIGGFLIDIFRIFTALGLMEKKELYRLAKRLYDLRNINKKKLKRILEWRNQH